jgi:hypothetical protein
MRADLFRLPALVLVAGLAAGWAGGLGAQDTLEAPAAAEAPAAPGAPVSGDRIAITGLTVAKGQVVDGDIVSPFGDVRIEGEVMGDVTVGKGNLVLAPGAVVHGDAIVNGGKLMNEGGRVIGEMRVNDADHAAAAHDMEAQIEEHVAREVERSVSSQTIRVNRGWFGSFGEGLEGLFSTLALGLVLAGAGAALVFYAREPLERVSHVARADTLRAGGIGLAAWFLAIPAFVVGLLALILTLIGIPLVLLYVPLFWVALAAACGYGLLAVAHAVGERTAERTGSYELRHRNAYTYVFTGIAILLAPKLIAHLLELTVILGWLGDLVEGLAWMLLWTAATVGFGAVVITRAGTRTGWPWRRPAAAYDPIFDDSPLSDAAPSGRGSHV